MTGPSALSLACTLTQYVPACSVRASHSLLLQLNTKSHKRFHDLIYECVPCLHVVGLSLWTTHEICKQEIYKVFVLQAFCSNSDLIAV